MTISIAKKVKPDILETEMLKHCVKSAVAEKCYFCTKTSLLAIDIETQLLSVELFLLYSI
jgi:PP-loop superfamily ATP-utilizing enzyme